MDVVAAYLRLGLAFDRLNRGFVDAWTGPDALRAEVESGPLPRADDLRRRAAELLDVEHISEHLYTRGQPDPDLVIRTSGEQRLSGFLLWQSAHSEFWFCEAHWPDFRRVDFLRALRAYAARQRRFGA